MGLVVKTIDGLTIKVHYNIITNDVIYVEFFEYNNITNFKPNFGLNICANSLRVSSISNVIFLTCSDIGIHYHTFTTFYPVTDFTWNVRTNSEVKPYIYEDSVIECNHEYVEYYGIKDAYRFCKKCDKKIPSLL